MRVSLALDAMRGRATRRLPVSPRGKAWTLGNARETLVRLLEQPGLPRYTLHGLRATGPTALKMPGAENRALRTLTGHTSDRMPEIYLRGVEAYPLVRAMGERFEQTFGARLADADQLGKLRHASRVTGRAAAKLKKVGTGAWCRERSAAQPCCFESGV